MEINEALIKKAAEHVMLNSCSVSSSGLFNGKAGMSLALFEVARFLEDEYIEDQALQTLQESLLTKTNDPGFENGLSGIGYVLLYLTKTNWWRPILMNCLEINCSLSMNMPINYVMISSPMEYCRCVI